MNRRELMKSLTAGLAATMTVSATKVGPDDTIVFETDYELSPEDMHYLKGQADAIWPGRKCIVLGGGLRLKVIRA